MFNPRASTLALTGYMIVMIVLTIVVWRKVSFLQGKIPL